VLSLSLHALRKTAARAGILCASERTSELCELHFALTRSGRAVVPRVHGMQCAARERTRVPLTPPSELCQAAKRDCVGRTKARTAQHTMEWAMFHGHSKAWRLLKKSLCMHSFPSSVERCPSRRRPSSYRPTDIQQPWPTDIQHRSGGTDLCCDLAAWLLLRSCSRS
jgi:hypothetical protein